VHHRGLYCPHARALSGSVSRYVNFVMLTWTYCTLAWLLLSASHCIFIHVVICRALLKFSCLLFKYYTVLAEMTRVGVDFCIDVHGDEALPYNFLSGSEGVGKWGPRLKHLQDKFAKSFRQVRFFILLFSL